MRDIINDIWKVIPSIILFFIAFIALLCTILFTWGVIEKALPLVSKEYSLEAVGHLMNASFIVLIISGFLLYKQIERLEDKDK